MKETRYQQGKLWASWPEEIRKKFPAMEQNYLEFKDEIDAELKPEEKKEKKKVK